MNIIPKPFLSVIICTHNRKNTIKKALDCILNQKCSFIFEVIIGEDLSLDGTREICLEYAKKFPHIIRILLHKEKCGVGKNWALLVKETKGKYVALCDDDDYWHNTQKLQMQVNFLENNLDFGMVHTNKHFLIEPKGKLKENINKKKIIPTGFIFKELFEGKVDICASSSLIRKDTIDKYVPLDLYIKHKFNAQDWPTWIFISKFVKIGYINISTTTYRTGHIGMSNLSSMFDQEKKVEKDHLMYKIICEYFPDDLKYDQVGYLKYKLGILLSYAFKISDFESAKNYALKLKNLGCSNLKIKVTENIFLFKLFIILKRLKNKFLHFYIMVYVFCYYSFI